MTHTLTTDELARLAETAALLARRVGGAIRTLREAGVAVAHTKSSQTDVVTAADREAERMVLEGLRELRPDDGVLGEEGTDVPGTSGITWVVDPIDGTVNYLYNLPLYAVSLAATVPDVGAAADGRRAIAGAVYIPVTDELFVASEGGGSTLNGAPLTGPRDAPLDSSLVATGFGYTAGRRREQAAIVSELLPRVRDIRRSGCASADLCYLAAGRVDAYYERGLQPWDYAAGLLIAREAGALVLGKNIETPPGEPLLVGAAPPLARSLHAAITESYARASAEVEN